MSKVLRIIDRIRGQQYSCSVNTCVAKTRKPQNPNPRLRWMIGIVVADENEKEIVLNLCPHHIREFFPELTEEAFKGLEKTERMLKMPVETDMVQ
jgi:hypothetical protein